VTSAKYHHLKVKIKDCSSRNTWPKMAGLREKPDEFPATSELAKKILQ
jgi:hypothetical protein